jgi:putative membrane protein
LPEVNVQQEGSRMKSPFPSLAAIAVALGVAATVPADAQRGPGRGAMTYVAKAGAGDLYEIQSSQMAATRARSPQVRAFAQMLVTDHERSTQMVADAARRDGLSPRPPMLEPPQRTMLRQLERARDRDFDRMYLNQQIPAHQQALNLHRTYARTGDGRALRQTAQGVVPVVQSHLERARQLSRMR